MSAGVPDGVRLRAAPDGLLVLLNVPRDGVFHDGGYVVESLAIPRASAVSGVC